MVSKRLGVRPADCAAPGSEFEARAPLAETLRKRPVSVLFVEDNEDLRSTFASILRIAGYEVTAAKNGKEGLENFASGNFDVVVSDLYMPVMGGLEMFLEIRKLRLTAKVIFLGGYFPDHSVDELAGSGAATVRSAP